MFISSVSYSYIPQKSIYKSNVSFKNDIKNAEKDENKKIAEQIIKREYDENTYIVDDQNSRRYPKRFYIFADKKFHNYIADGSFINDENGNLKYITIQDHNGGSSWNIGTIKVFDLNGNVVKKLSPEQAKVIRNYRGNLATNLNSALRHFHDTSFYQKEIDAMDSLFTSPEIYSVFEEDGELYRGININEHNIDYFQDNLQVGKIITDKGFTSTTSDKNRMSHYGNYYLKIKVPKGTKYIDMPLLTSPSEYYIHESEVLLNRNSKFLISDYDADTHTFTAQLLK